MASRDLVAPVGEVAGYPTQHPQALVLRLRQLVEVVPNRDIVGVRERYGVEVACFDRGEKPIGDLVDFGVGSHRARRYAAVTLAASAHSVRALFDRAAVALLDERRQL